MPPPTKPFIGIDLGGTNMQVGVVSSELKLLSQAKKKTKAEDGLEGVMNRIVEGFPTTKLSSLPQHLPNGRIIELSIRGDPAAVPAAMQQMKDEVHHLGFRFDVK